MNKFTLKTQNSAWLTMSLQETKWILNISTAVVIIFFFYLMQDFQWIYLFDRNFASWKMKSLNFFPMRIFVCIGV